jgi:hypothetical protein
VVICRALVKVARRGRRSASWSWNMGGGISAGEVERVSRKCRESVEERRRREREGG